jgi:hypothetical protein
MSTHSNAIDHIVFASADLERGMDEIEQLLGIRPVPGGRHPQFGTHNALLSLGPATYLEVIARDPNLPLPEQGTLVDLSDEQESHLITWVLRTEDIVALASAAGSAGLAIGPVQSGSREQPDGNTLCWQLTDPYAMPMGGAIPFLISWGETAHPASVVPHAGELLGLIIEHPDSTKVRQSVSVLEVDVAVVQADKFGLVARIETEDGVKILK